MYHGVSVYLRMAQSFHGLGETWYTEHVIRVVGLCCLLCVHTLPSPTIAQMYFPSVTDTSLFFSFNTLGRETSDLRIHQSSKAKSAEISRQVC